MLAYVYLAGQVVIRIALYAGVVVTEQDVLLVTVGQMAVSVVVYAVSCSWLVRARRRSASSNPHYRYLHKRPWVWMAWVIPVVNFVVPYRVVRDVHTAVVGRDSYTVADADPEHEAMFKAWWAAWLVNVFGTWAANGMEGWDGALWLDGIALLGCWVALLGWTTIVRQISHAEHRHQARPTRTER